MGEKPAMMKMAVDDRPSLSRQAMDNHWRQKQAIDEQQQQDLKISSSTTPGHIKYLVIVCCILVYFLLPLPAVFNAGNYLTATSLATLLSFSIPSSSSSSPCTNSLFSDYNPGHRHQCSSSPSYSSYSSISDYRAILEDPRLSSSNTNNNVNHAKGRPSIHAGPRDQVYNAHIENIFLKVPNNESCIKASRSYTAFAHIAGKAGDFEVSNIVKQQWENLLGLPVSGKNKHVFDAGSKQSRRALLSKSDAGVRVWTDTYYVLLNHPTPVSESKTAIKLHDAQGKVIFKAKLKEDALEQDPTSRHGNKDVPPFHGYSKAGSAEGELVYAHSGTVEDFKLLKENGVDVTGKIAIVRYGGNFRGLKVKAAQEAGAAGCIIYSDPAEDGEITVDNGYAPYPAGPARQPSSLQRGSVQYLSKYPGDPTTPGEPSYKDSKRTKPHNIPDIPSLPLSYEDAIPLLKSLNGRGPCIDAWKGGLGYQDVQYCSGPSEGKVSMTNDVKSDTFPIWNTYARIEGHIKDEVVMLGNHRDAWVFGAVDPNSGTATVHEIVKGLGELLKRGWKPLRTILIASWDGEEYGLLGSTEMAEDYGNHASKVVAYLNLDGAAGGSQYSVKASPSLADLFRNVSLTQVAGIFTEQELDIGPLGSGSDYTAFLQHLGIASSDMGYRGKHTDPVYHYHSIYDSEYWVERYGDPGFGRHIKIAQILGLAALRLSESPILPLNITRYTEELDKYLTKVKETAKSAGIVDVDFSKTASAISNVQHSAHLLDKEIKLVLKTLPAFTGGRQWQDEHTKRKMEKKLLRRIRSINKRKMTFERGFIAEEGLPRRSWYRHLGVAPGENLGYGATTFPGVTEAITIAEDRDLLEQELSRLTKHLEQIARDLRKHHDYEPWLSV